MQKRAVAVSVAAALLGLAAAALGFAAEHFKHKALVGRSGALRCEYRRTPALGCGILAAALSLSAAVVVTAASGCFSRCGAGAAAAESGRRRATGRNVLATLAWLLVLSAAAMFLYGASRNTGGTGNSFTAVSRRRPGGGSDIDIVCSELRDGVFVSAAIDAAIGIACAIAAYVDIVRHRDRTVTLGVVAMGQPAYPAPVAYPAQPPYGGYGGAKQPGGTA
ncbi:unnamed protein product [Urochloa decumbens]|uniref:Uncharacterized protein n=1 Tax=Urochloa decumbens TaxID=240449 RepID=A0ABC8ZZQ2_9POAL